MNVIELRLPKTLTRISGNDYGYHIYETQVRNQIKNSAKNQIVFPSYIEGVDITDQRLYAIICKFYKCRLKGGK